MAKKRVLVLGDLSGRSNRGAEEATGLATRPIQRLDLDHFDAVLRGLAPALRLTLLARPAAPDTTVQFESLDDFHPDRLLLQLNLLAGAQRQAPTASPGAAPDSGKPASLLEGLMGGAVASSIKSSAGPAAIVDALIRRTIQPDPPADGDRLAAPYSAAAEASMTQALRSVLHHPDVQALESAWRGLRRFVEGVDLDDGEVELYVLDVAKAELLADAGAHAGDSTASALYQRLRRSSAIDDGPSWSLLIGHFAIEADTLHLALLAHLGSIAAQLRAPLLASADPGLAGAQSLAELARPARWSIEADLARLWLQLRRSPVAPWIGLTLPRLLLRQPYGARSDSIEALAFEELATANAHDGYLWGSSALACGQWIAQALNEQESPSLHGAFDIEDLPTVVRLQDGERTLLPCAELHLQTATGEKLSELGFVTLLSYANRNAVRVSGLQSITEPTQRLAGLD